MDKWARWLQRMLDNGVEVVVAVRKDGVPPWCRRICRLHHDLGYWDTGAGCCVGVHASKKPVAPQPLGVQVLQPCRMGPASGGTRALRARLRRRGPSPETRASTTRALPLVKAMGPHSLEDQMQYRSIHVPWIHRDAVPPSSSHRIHQLATRHRACLSRGLRAAQQGLTTASPVVTMAEARKPAQALRAIRVYCEIRHEPHSVRRESHSVRRESP